MKLYKFLLFLTNLFSEEIKEKFEGKLEKEMSGPTYEVLGKIMKHIVGRKLTGPGGFIGFVYGF